MSFPFVQVQAVVNSSGATFFSNSVPGNIIVAVWGGVKSGFAAGQVPASCTDNNGNLYSRCSTYIENQLGIAIFIAVNIAAAVPHQPVAVTFATVSGLITNSPSVIILEYGPPPANFQVYGQDCQGNAAGLVRFQYGQLAGLLAAASIQYTRMGGNSDQVAAVILANQFSDLLLVSADYCQGAGSVVYSVSPGTIRATTHEVTGATYDNWLAASDANFNFASGCGTNPSNLGILCGSPPSGNVGTAYSHTFPVSGGFPPYTFSITSGSLPPGLTLNTSTGVVSGTPTTLGTYTFTVQVTDSLGSTASANCSITINSPGGGGNPNLAYYSRH